MPGDFGPDFSGGQNQLGIYNEALGHLGERQIMQLSNGNFENKEAKRVLDSYWGGAVAYCLAQGLWRFARRFVQQDADTTVVPQFGFLYAFPYQSDWVRTIVISGSPQLDPPLQQYRDEGGYVYTNVTPIYHDYVSIDPGLGGNVAKWPANFADYVARRLARQACFRLTDSKELIPELIKQEEKSKRIAKGSDAMNDPPGLPPVPFWVRARRGAFGPGGLWYGSSNTGENGSIDMGPG
jgi:hypothetical protein